MWTLIQKSMNKKICIKYCTLMLLLTVSGNILQPAHGQVSLPKERSLYTDPIKTQQDLELKTGEMLKVSPYLDLSAATLQLAESIGNKVSIKRLPVRKKKLELSELAKTAKESTVIFGTAYDCGRCHLTHVNPASGYIVDEDGIIVTNYHVVEGFTKSERNTNIAMPIQTADGKIYFVTQILASDPGADLCIVQVDTRGDKLTPFPLGNAAQQGDPIYVMSHPNQMRFYFTEGIVARNYLSRASRSDERLLPQMEITADYAAGSSGGPIVDQYGNLVSTVSSTRSIYYNPEDQKNLQMVVKNTKPVILLKDIINWKS